LSTGTKCGSAPLLVQLISPDAIQFPSCKMNDLQAMLTQAVVAAQWGDL